MHLQDYVAAVENIEAANPTTPEDCVRWGSSAYTYAAEVRNALWQPQYRADAAQLAARFSTAGDRLVSLCRTVANH